MADTTTISTLVPQIWSNYYAQALTDNVIYGKGLTTFKWNNYISGIGTEAIKQDLHKNKPVVVVITYK